MLSVIQNMTCYSCSQPNNVVKWMLYAQSANHYLALLSTLGNLPSSWVLLLYAHGMKIWTATGT